MGKVHSSIQSPHQDFIQRQKMFFVGTAPLSSKGHVNLSPKGLDSFRVITPERVAYMDMVGSGNETSAHILENGRITFMFCSFEGPPNILRLYGTGFTMVPSHPEWNELAALFPRLHAARQIIVADIHRVQTSCGFGVPLYTYAGEREQMSAWAEAKGPEGIKAYLEEKNQVSVDGLPTALALSKAPVSAVQETAPGSLIQ